MQGHCSLLPPQRQSLSFNLVASGKVPLPVMHPQLKRVQWQSRQSDEG